MLIDAKKLWDKGGYGKDNPFDKSIQYVHKIGDQGGLPREETNKIIVEFFIGLKNGDKYSTKKCFCGCGIDKSGTDAVHELVRRVQGKIKVTNTQAAKALVTRINDAIVKHMAADNEAYTKEQLGPPRLLNWEKSPVINGVKKLWTSLQ